MNLSIDTTPVSLILMVIIGLISFLGFRNEELIKKTIFSPYRIKETNEWYRFLTSGFIHADWMHLIFNMYVFAQFSGIIEQTFNNKFGDIYGKAATLTLFLVGVVVSHITGYFKHKNHPWYQSLGASGGVSSILFAFIFLYPTQKLQIMFIPVGIPAFLIGVGYMW
jgi:membrane associated rhomboid family serine protease